MLLASFAVVDILEVTRVRAVPKSLDRLKVDYLLLTKFERVMVWLIEMMWNRSY